MECSDCQTEKLIGQKGYYSAGLVEYIFPEYYQCRTCGSVNKISSWFERGKR